MNPYSFFVVFEGSGQIRVPYAEGGNSNAVISVVAASGSPVEAVLFQQHRSLWSCSRTEGQAQHARVGTGTLSHLGCRPVCKSWVISFLLSGILVLVPAGERVNGALLPHPHNCRALLLSFLRFGNFPPRALGWRIACLVSEAGAGQWHRACMGRAARQLRLPLRAGVWKSFLCMSRYPLIKRFSNCQYKETVTLLVKNYKYLQSVCINLFGVLCCADLVT